MSNIQGYGVGSTQMTQNTQSSQKPSQDDSNSFEDAMEKKEKKQDKKEDGQGVSANQQAQLKGKGAVDAMQKTNAADSVDKINKIVDQIIAKEAGATKEVKVSFGDKFLPGTEMLINKNNGKMTVDFLTTSPESMEFLKDGQHALSNRLNDKFENVTVNINMQNRDMDQGQDGRSRNEFIKEDDEQDS